MSQTLSLPTTPRGVSTREQTYWRQTAYHEAGHCLSVVLLGIELDPTIAMKLDPNSIHHAGITYSLQPPPSTPELRFREAVTWLAGKAAVPWGGPEYDDDLAAVRKLVDLATAKRAYAYARELLAGRHEQLNALATALVAERTLSAARVYQVLGMGPRALW